MCCMHQDPSYSGSIAPLDQMKGARKCDGTVQGSSNQHCYLSMLKNSTSLFGGKKKKTCASPFLPDTRHKLNSRWNKGFWCLEVHIVGKNTAWIVNNGYTNRDLLTFQLFWRETKNLKDIYQVWTVCWILAVFVQILLNSLRNSSCYDTFIGYSQIQFDKSLGRFARTWMQDTNQLYCEW